MSDVEHLLSLISCILQPKDKVQRENAERGLVNLRASNPNELMLAFLMILAGQYQSSHRNFSASQLRLCLSNFAPSSYKNVWDHLTDQTRSHIKTELFKVLFAEADLLIKKHIANSLGQIAASLLSKDISAWPQFKTTLWELFKEPSGNGVLSGFNVLESFLPFCPTLFSDNSRELFILFQNGFQNENYKIKLSALNAFSSYLQVLEQKEQNNFKLLINDIFNSTYSLLINESNEEGLQILAGMLDVDYKFFKDNFKELSELLQSIFKIKDIQSGVKRMVTEILVDYSQKCPTIFRKNKQYLNMVLHMVFVHMIEIDNSISEEWKNPEEGYNSDMEDDEDFETTRFGMGAIDRIIYSVGDKEVLPMLSEAIKELLKNSDWRYQYTAIMALSQIGEYMEDPSHISSIIQMILHCFTNDNPMIRYASCHAIGQISDDLKPKFQEIYGQQTYPLLVQLLNDNVPRVVSHSAAALTNFLQGLKYDEALPHLNEMMQLLVNHSNNGISIVKESCLGSISSVAEICKENFSNYLEVTAALLFKIIQTYTSKEYKQLRGQAIETMTIIASSVGAKLFQPAVERLINIMIQIQESKLEQIDPQKSYILAGWQRLCQVYGQELGCYLDKILPSLFALVRNVINNQLQQGDSQQSNTVQRQDSEEKEGAINTFETEQAEVAISMLNVFIEQLKEHFIPYVEETIAILCKIIKEHSNDNIKEEALKCLPNLVSAIKNSNKEAAINMTKYFMTTLIETIEKESDPKIMIVQLETLKSVIEDLNLCFLNESEIQQFSKKMLTMLHDCETNKEKTSKFIKEEGSLDEDETEVLNDQIKEEEEVQISISEIFGILFKTHSDSTIQIAQHLITQVLRNVLKPKMSDNSYKLAIFMIDDMVQHLGYNRLSQYWEQFGKVLVSFCQQKNLELRQAACYGLGIYAQNTPPCQSAIIQSWLHCLVLSSKIEKGNEKEKSFGHCQDNAVSAIGKIIKTHGQSFNCSPFIGYWFSLLPLKFDKPEALIQHEFLVDIMLNKPELIIETSPQSQLSNFKKVLSTYASILGNQKLSNDSIKKKIKIHLFSLQSFSPFAEHEDEIWAALDEQQKQCLAKLITN